MVKRKTVILGQKQMSYSKAIQEITGWDKKRFETEKRLMRYRVAKFNQATGSNLSPIEQLFYRVRFEDRQAYYKAQGKQVNDYNVLQSFFKNVKTGKYNPLQKIKYTDKDGTTVYTTLAEYGRHFVLDRYEGLGRSYSKAQAILDELKAGTIQPADANKLLAQFADDMRKLKNDPETFNDWVELHNNEIGSP